MLLFKKGREALGVLFSFYLEYKSFPALQKNNYTVFFQRY